MISCSASAHMCPECVLTIRTRARALVSLTVCTPRKNAHHGAIPATDIWQHGMVSKCADCWMVTSVSGEADCRQVNTRITSLHSYTRYVQYMHQCLTPAPPAFDGISYCCLPGLLPLHAIDSLFNESLFDLLGHAQLCFKLTKNCHAFNLLVFGR